MEANRSTSGFDLGLQLQEIGESHTSPGSTETQGHFFDIDKGSGRVVGHSSLCRIFASCVRAPWDLCFRPVLMGDPPPYLCKHVPCFHGFAVGVLRQILLTIGLTCRIFLAKDLRALFGLICAFCLALRSGQNRRINFELTLGDSISESHFALKMRIDLQKRGGWFAFPRTKLEG